LPETRPKSATAPETAAALPPLRETIARHGIAARRALGQNFLLDLNLTRRIARAAGDLAGTTVVEIGPGPGGLTRALLETAAARVVAIERDPRCIAALAELAALHPGRLTVVEGDALAIDATDAGSADGRPRAIVANLPYNIATPLLLGWLRRIDRFASLTLMFQKEVAERLAALPGSRAYGRLSVIAQWLCEVRSLFDIPPQAAFGQRRKMLKGALRSLTADPVGLLAAAGIDPTARAETLTVEQFCALARAFGGRG
jgi:16S rRNA (adenine1518-N6/adenine1519-N6)-dimethyltransferase